MSGLGVARFVIPAIKSTGQSISLSYYISSAFICLLLALTVAYTKGHLTLLPDSLVDEMSSDEHYFCKFSSTEHLREACEMTKPYYRNDYVSADIAEQWRMKNPEAFVQITNSNGELCAFFGILALRKSFMDLYIEGKVADTQLDEQNILNLENSRKCDRLYISGVIVRNHLKHIGRKRARVMLWAILAYIKSIYGLRKKRELFAVAVTKESERLMKKLGFQLTCGRGQRQDKHNMYSYALSKKSWEYLMYKVGDFSRMCSCEYSPKHHLEAPKEK